MTIKQIEFIILKHTPKKPPGPDVFIREFFQMFNEGLLPTIHNLFKKSEVEKTLANSFNEARIILIPQQRRENTKKENYKPISLMHMGAKILNKLSAIYEKNYTP